MPLPRLIPCLDVANGRVVKGVSFVGLRDVGDPVELAAVLQRGWRRRTRVPRHRGDARRQRDDDVGGRPSRRRVGDSLHRRWRRTKRRVTPLAHHRVRRGPRVAQLGRARRSLSHHRDCRALRQPGRGGRDRRGRRSGAHPRRTGRHDDANVRRGPSKRPNEARERYCSPRSVRTENERALTSNSRRRCATRSRFPSSRRVVRVRPSTSPTRCA